MIGAGGQSVDEVHYDVEEAGPDRLLLIARIGDTDARFVPTRLFEVIVKEIR